MNCNQPRPPPARPFVQDPPHASRSLLGLADRPLHIVNIFKLPPNASLRDVRKAIGRATYTMQRDPLIKFSVDIPRTKDYPIGKIIFADAAHADAWMERYGGRHSLYRVEIDGTRLGFSKSMDSIDPYLLKAIEDKDEEEIDSDYDEEGDGKDHSKYLKLSRLECGAFDDEGRFCVGWSKAAESASSVVSFDVDEARLRIRCETLVVQASIYDIRWIYTGTKSTRVYFEFKNPPMFLRDMEGDPSAETLTWLESAPTSFKRTHEKFQRVPAYDSSHACCVQYGTVYRVHICGDNEIIPFIKSTKGRLCLRAKVSELSDGGMDAFDSTGVDSMLEKLNFSVAFQVQALLGPHKLLPKDVMSIRKELITLQKNLGPKEAAKILRNLRSHLCSRGPLAKHEQWASFSMEQVRDNLIQSAKVQSVATAATFAAGKDSLNKALVKEKMMIHSAFITPSFGLRLEGPHPDDGNRILRSFPGQDENFIRVHLTEEDCSTFRVVQDYGSIDSEVMLHGRFGNALREGIMIGGRKFQFLAFSGSSLREHSCWYVRSFKLGKEKIKASTIRAKIGSLDHLRSPARYAARMGQAFTATSTSISIRADSRQVLPDIATRDGRYEFSDGVGRMSKEVCDRLNTEIYRDRLLIPAVPPSAFQIRMGGAKGMLSLDTKLKGEQVILRKSMVKFESEPVDGCFSLEVANFYPRPVPMFLNRPMVALLESLGVDPEAFVDLQNDALQALEEATKDPMIAIQLHQRNGVGRASNVEGIIHSLHANGINAITQIPFLHDANISLVNFALRNIKYRARIRVPHCHTVVGVMDETNTLAENQIIVCINEPGKPINYLKGRCLLGRSPMLAPGDLQYAHAVTPPASHPLRAITNAIIFSQKGTRPIASMLSGGDLDGDLFNIIQHPRLMPDFTCDPANYAKNALLELKRPCDVNDVIDFFLDYIKMDKLGLIATRHLELSDRSKDGVLDPDCLTLAAMHSIAVDFSKSGLLPEIKAMPKAPRQKPDYRKPEFRNEDRSEETAKRHPRSKDTYYRSTKALGKMFRAIDVYKQTCEWEKVSREFEVDWMDNVWELLNRKKRGGKWKVHLRVQRDLVEEYYSRMWVIAQEQCPEDKGGKLEEEEVFMGHIICRGPNGSRMSPFDVTNRLQDDFQVVCQDVRKRALFDPVTLNDEARLKKSPLWHWLISQVGKPISESDLLQVERDEQRNLKLIHQQLYSVLQRGLAWTKAALETSPERGRSAPWIIIPALLSAHTCLDVIESFWQRQGEDALSLSVESTETSSSEERNLSGNSSPITAAAEEEEGGDNSTDDEKVIIHHDNEKS